MICMYVYCHGAFISTVILQESVAALAYIKLLY